MAPIVMDSANWTFEDTKAFEIALAHYFNDKDRWSKIALSLPGKTQQEIQRQFELLQEDVSRISDRAYATEQPEAVQAEPSGKRSKTSPEPTAQRPAGPAVDRRKGVSWTQDEHRLFLLGLSKFGKGSWRSIARQYVVTRTPTQVASHAQKYFLRLNSIKDKKDKRRASIHDITTDHVMPYHSMGQLHQTTKVQ